MNDTPDATLHVRDLTDLLGVIPSLLGFHPTDSLVLVCLREGRVAVTARADLAHLTSTEALAACFDPLWDRFFDAYVIAVAYTPDAALAWWTLDALQVVMPPDMPLDAAHADGHRWRREPDGPGVPYDPATSALAAEAAYRGLPVLPGRDALADSLGPVISEAEFLNALETVADRGLDDMIEVAVRLTAQLMREPRAIDAVEAATLALAAFSPAFADSTVCVIDTANAGAARALWTSVVRCTAGYTSAGASVLLGMAAWIGGDGALMNVCLERAAPYAAEQQWFRFLEIASKVALPPSEWDAVRRDLLRGLDAA